ncbi:MAG: hypothetical protein AABX07_03195 [Nanoarchaeota archaeon]
MINLGQAVSYNFPYYLTERQVMMACNTIDRDFRAFMKRVAFIPKHPYGAHYVYSNPKASVCLSWTKRADTRTEVRAEGYEFVRDKGIELIAQVDSILKRAEKIGENESKGMTFLPTELPA